jgi:hypothetical protein
MRNFSQMDVLHILYAVRNGTNEIRKVSLTLQREKWGGAKSIQTFIVLSIPVVHGSMEKEPKRHN